MNTEKITNGILLHYEISGKAKTKYFPNEEELNKFLAPLKKVRK